MSAQTGTVKNLPSMFSSPFASVSIVGWLRLLLLTSLLSLFQASAVAEVAATSTPRAVVNDSSTALLALIEESRPWAKQEPDRFYAAVEAILSPAIDFPMFARNVMSGYYKQATADQRARFASSFKWSLVRTYALALTEFNAGEINVLEAVRPSPKPGRDRVKMEIRTSAGQVYPMVYSMRLGKDKKWRVYNVVVNGVNMGLTFRSQFAAAMQDNQYGGDIDEVIDAWSVQASSSQ